MDDDITRYTKAVNFAAIKHRDQRRKDDIKTPYINHPIGVAHILVVEGRITDVDTLIAAILHDTVEDTDTTFEEIEEQFGEAVRKIVEEVTDDKTLGKAVRKQLQIEHAKDCSTKAKQVKLADKLYNLRDLLRCTPEGWTKQRSEDYFEWAKKVVDNLKGANKDLEAALDELFRDKGLM